MRKCLFIFIFFLVKTIGMAQSVDSTDYADSTDYIDSTDYEHSLDNDHLIIDTSKYAILYVYRPFNIVGAVIGYDLHVDDKVVCRVKNGKKCAIKIYKEGSVEVWAETEARKSVKLNVKFGDGYYIKCGLSPGMAVGRPSLLIQQESVGKEMYLKIKEKK